jgi:hypothetical protein
MPCSARYPAFCTRPGAVQPALQHRRLDRNTSAQVAAFGSVALYAAYYAGEAKLEASTLYIVVGALTAVWAVAFGVLLLTIERKYARTFLSTETGGEFAMNHFCDNAGNDELQAQIFTNSQELWRSIRPQVEAWLRARFKIWKREKPAWFTEALRRSIPTDMLLPRDARGSSVHDASLARRLSLSLGVRVPEVKLQQVVPLGATDSEASDSESPEDEAQLPPDATRTTG